MIDLVIGRRELGKTTLACHLAREFSPSLTIDPRAQFRIGAGADLAVDVDAEQILFSLEQGENIVVQPRYVQEAVDALPWSVEQYISGAPGRTVTVILDEAGLYNVQAWSYLLRCSPRSRTRFIFTAHRPTDISTDVRSIADTWYIFRTVQAHDLDAIEERCGAQVREAVQELDPFQYVAWNDAKARAMINRSPASWYTPLAIGA